jgi:hypothetical protein
MALIYRLVKNSPLTFQEGDDNLHYLEDLSLSGSFIINDLSSSFDERIAAATNEQDLSIFATTSSLNDFSSSYVNDSSSFDERIIAATNEGQFATTGSNHFYGNQTITGNLSSYNFSATDTNVTINANFSPQVVQVQTYNGAKFVVNTNDQGEVDITSPKININGNTKIQGSLITNIMMNPQTILQSTTVPSGYNALLLGPVGTPEDIIVEDGALLTIL